jgi:hypothetical protein
MGEILKHWTMITVQERQRSEDDVDLKCGVCGFAQGAAQREWHPKCARWLHTLGIFAHQAYAGGEQALSF